MLIHKSYGLFYLIFIYTKMTFRVFCIFILVLRLTAYTTIGVRGKNKIILVVQVGHYRLISVLIAWAVSIKKNASEEK